MRTIARELVLTVGAALGLLCIGFAIAVHAFGIAPLVVRSGSMAPTMPWVSAFSASIAAISFSTWSTNRASEIGLAT